jgi:hypothetical protein
VRSRARHVARLPLLAAVIVALFIPAASRERTALTRACLGGSRADRCEQLGDRIARGGVRALYPEEAGLYFALACEEGVARACRRAGAWASLYPDYEALETDVGCMLRDSGFACEEVAGALRLDRDGAPGAPDRRPLGRARMLRALELHLAGCASGDAESCLGASRVYDAGFGVPRSPDDARRMEAKACALGLASACEGRGDRLAGLEAVTFYRKACEAPRGSPHACLKLARACEAADMDPDAIEAAYRRACDERALDACAWLASRGAGPSL